jgi:hypothetical protein
MNSWAVGPILPLEHSGHCLKALYNAFSSEPAIYLPAKSILFSRDEQNRYNLLSIYHAFHDVPDIFKHHVKELVEEHRNKPIWGTPLFNGAVFKTLPTTRSFMYQSGISGTTNVISDISFGDFIDLNGDGLPDLVVSFFTPDYEFTVDWGTNYYYKATFLNVGHGWTMNHCETNMDDSVFGQYQWLGVPCPS